MAIDGIGSFKRCSKCGESKPFSGFFATSRTNQTPRQPCKGCVAIAQKNRNPERRREIARRATAAYVQRWSPPSKCSKCGEDNPECGFYPGQQQCKDCWTAHSRAWSKANRATKNVVSLAWKRANVTADDRRAENHRRRASRLASCGRFKADQIRQLLIDQEYRCANPFCRADLMEIAPHIDHKIPLTRGGTNDIANLQWLCAPCNVRKWTYKMDEWLAKIGG